MTRVRVGPGDDVVGLVRGAAGESVLVMLDPALDPVELARARAAIGPLAVERAPATRVNALLAAAGADPIDVEAAAKFLEGACSTTGQVLDISPRRQGPSASGRTAPAARLRRRSPRAP